MLPKNFFGVLCRVLLGLMLHCQSVALAADFTPGNLLIVHEQSKTLREYTPAGTLIQTIPIPPSSTSSTESPRDVVSLDASHVAVYNGTFTPWLSRLDSQANSWTHNSESGWSTVNDRSYGGLARFGNQFFVTDMNTGDAAHAPQGMLRFDMPTSSWTRFGSSNEFIDVTMGLDGKLYGLTDSYSDSPGGLIRVFDPVTLALERSINLQGGNSVRGIAANLVGDLFAVGYDATLRRFDRNGILLNTLNMGVAMSDIDLNSNHQLLALGNNSVFLMTDNLSPVSSFVLPETYPWIFGAFVVPEPQSIVGFGLLSIMVLLFPRRSHLFVCS